MPPTPEQPHLNGAFYGPPVTKSSNRPGRRRGGATSCNPITCCFSCICSCIFNLIFQILITLFIILAILALIFWFIFRPNVPKFHVDDVTLTRFNLSSTNRSDSSNHKLFYNMDVNMTFRNPNRRMGIYYDVVEASGVYQGERFSTVEIDRFYLGHKMEKSVSVGFKGEQVLGGKVKFEDGKSDEVYKIDLKLRLKIRFKVWCMKSPKFKPKFECDLKVPLSGKGGDVKFERTKCDFDW